MTSGALIIDKPQGLTSHDVVRRVRKALSTRKVGHAGTLDPMATGVLVVLVGEGTKLVPYLTANDKRYRAGVLLGRSTDTLDAEGETVAQAPLPPWWPDEERVEAVLETERGRAEQQPPIYSAIKVAGKSAHARVRAGEQVELAARPVAVRHLTLDRRLDDSGTLWLTMEVSKGYYVRALARDIGEGLGIPAHLSSLRREASGVFTLDEAVQIDDIAEARLMPVTEAAQRALPSATLSEEGAARTRCGARLGPADFVGEVPSTRSAWLDEAGVLVAVGDNGDEGPKVVRVFNLNG